MTQMQITLLALVACMSLATFGYFRHFKRRDDRLIAPVIPWSIIALAALATGFMLLVHVVNLLGFETGR